MEAENEDSIDSVKNQNVEVAPDEPTEAGNELTENVENQEPAEGENEQVNEIAGEPEKEETQIEEGAMEPVIEPVMENVVDETPEINETTASEEIKRITSAKDDVEIVSKVSSYIKSNSKEDKEPSVGGEESLFNRTNSLDLHECALGQELLNELYNTMVSSEHDMDVEVMLGSIGPDGRSTTGKKDSITSSERVANRIDLINNLRVAMEERKSLMDVNRIFQSKLVEYFKLAKAKQKTGLKPVSEKDLLIDFSTQYERYREILKHLMDELDLETNKYQEKIEKLQILSEIKTRQNDDVNKDFIKYQENVGFAALHSRTGFKLDPTSIRDFFQAESKKETIIKSERLSNLKLEHKNMRFDKALRSKENFEGGLRLIDFEQLKIENQTFNEKVEERREAINKLNRKINNCNHLLSHIKEKINFTDNDKKTSHHKLQILNREFKKKQKACNKFKKTRDYVKSSNKTLQMSCGLLGKKDYLRKYEETNDNVQHLRDKILNMQYNIRDITVATNGLANKIIHEKNKIE